MQQSKALVTLAIGQDYLNRWKTFCQANWQKYAQKYGYDIICIDTPLDNSIRAQQRSPAWQKCLILNQEFAQHYERVVWIDADIVINTSIAPCIVKNVPVDKVGAVEAFSSPTAELSAQVSERRAEFQKSEQMSSLKAHTPKGYYVDYGISPEFEQVVQTGVMVLTPHCHQRILEKTYFDYEEKGGSEWNYEMRPLSHQLLKSNVVHWLDHRFNLCWADYRYLYYPFLLNKPQPDYSIFSAAQHKLASSLGVASRYRHAKLCATTAFINSFFLHFAGCAADVELVNLNATSWHDCTEERVTAAINHDLAQSYFEQGQSDQALSLYEQCLELQEHVNDVCGKAVTLHHIANIYIRQGQFDQALSLYQQSLELQEHIDDASGKAATLSMMGRLSVIQGNFAIALAYFQESLEILQFIASPDVQAVAELMAELQSMR